MIKGGILFLLLAAALIAGYSKLDSLRTGILGSIGAERKLLKERLVEGDAAIEKLKDLETLKRRYFSGLTSAISRPLLAISGQIAGIKLAIDAGESVNSSDIKNRIHFSTQEIENLRTLVSDYEQIELFRQSLVNADSRPISLSKIIVEALQDLDLERRLPNLTVTLNVPENLPTSYGDNRLLVDAISRLITYSTHASGSGELNISMKLTGENTLQLIFSGSAYDGAAAPTAALLDEARQLITELSSGFVSSSKREKLMGIVLAKAVIEHFGGVLEVGSSDNPGFIIYFPAAN